ncbi:MAG: MBL fold metallo-hydrolase [Acidobacteria bacterium]|nr:MBL fold metallo-hydrolase [Acidobacteriota bacterium]
MLAILLALNLDAVRALGTIDVNWSGTRSMLHQSYRVEGPLDAMPWRGRAYVDFRKNRFLAETHSTYPKDEVFAYRWVVEGDKGFVFDLQRNNQGTEAVVLEGAGAEAARWQFTRTLPPLVLLYAAGKGVNLDGPTAEIEQPDGTKAMLVFDPQTHRLDRIEQTLDDPILGEVKSVSSFSQYREIRGVPFPIRRVDTMNGVVIRDMKLDIKVGSEADEALFKLPAGWTMPVANAPQPEEIRKLAEGVWADTLRSNSLIVEMKDHVIAIEAPGGPQFTQQTIDHIKKLVPNKPIRYLAFTHPHSDHAGGTAAYVNEGATIITTPANVKWVQRLAKLTRKPKIETIAIGQTRVLKDENHSVELFTIKTSHVEEQLFAWLPKERILFQADLFFAATTGPIGPQFPHTLRELRAMMAKRRIDPAYVIDPDGRIATGAEFAAAK